jgi:hypothetical protein
VRTLDEGRSVAAGNAVRVELPVAELRVVGHDSDRVEITVELDCSRSSRRCLETAEDVELEIRDGTRGLEIGIGGLPKWSRGGMDMEVEIHMPQTSPLVLEMGVGDIEIEGLGSDLEAEVGVGEIEVAMSRHVVGDVEIDTGVGQASIEVEGESVAARRFFLGDEVRWADGAGRARLSIEVGVGEVVVELD